MRAMAFPCFRSLQLVSLLVAFHAALGLARPAGTGATVLPDTWCTNGRVEAQVVHNQTLYVGGGFDMVGPPTGGAAVLDEVTGVVQSPFPRVDGIVHVVKPDGVGGWYLGGEFESVQGVPRKNLAHIDAGGAVTPWSLEVNDLVSTIAIGNGTVFVGGMFDSIAGQPRGGVAAIDQAGAFLTTWNPTVTGVISGAGGGSWVKSIVLSGDKVYLGGSFTSVAGSPRGGFAEVDAATGIPTSWAVGSGSVNAMMLSGTNLYLGTGTNVSGNVRVFDIATRDSLSITQFTGNVNALVEDPGTGVVYVGGFFDSAGGIPRNSLAALAGPMGGVTAWNPVVEGLVFGLALSGTDGLVVGGNFQTLGGQSRRYLGSVNRTTGAVLPLAPKPGATVRSVAVGDGKIYVGGIFTLMNGVERYRLAALDVTTGLPAAWAPNPVPLSGGVYAMFLHGTTLYVGGDFSQLEGQSRNGAGAFDLTTGMLTAWDPNVQGGRVLAIDVFDFFGSITVYLAGDFDQVGGWSRGHLAAVDGVSGAVTTFGDARLNGPAWAVYRDRSMSPTAALYVAGSFTAAGQFLRNRLAAFYPFDGLLLPWDPNADGTVDDLVPVTGTFGEVTGFYLAGSFTVIGGQPRRGLAEIGVSGAVTAWNPDVTGSVIDIERVGETIYAGGLFTAVDGQPRQNLAAVNAVNGTVLSWGPKVSTTSGLQAAVRSIVNRSTFMHVGGEFRNVGGASLGNLATIGGTVTSVEATDRAPAAPHALRAAPNPFGGETALHFSLTRREPVVVSVYDVAGRLVRDLHQGALGPGSYRVPWDGRDGGGRLVGSGVYVLRLKSPTVNVSSKVFRLK